MDRGLQRFWNVYKPEPLYYEKLTYTNEEGHFGVPLFSLNQETMNILNQPENPKQALLKALYDLIETYTLALEVNAVSCVIIDPSLKDLPLESLATLYIKKKVTIQECTLLLYMLATSTYDTTLN